MRKLDLNKGNFISIISPASNHRVSELIIEKEKDPPKRYKTVENGIEYEVFDCDLDDDSAIREIDKIENSIIKRTSSGGYHTVYYFKYGDGHNAYGPAIVRYLDGVKLDEFHFMGGDMMRLEEWKSHNRSRLIDEMLG